MKEEVVEVMEMVIKDVLDVAVTHEEEQEDEI